MGFIKCCIERYQRRQYFIKWYLTVRVKVAIFKILIDFIWLKEAQSHSRDRVGGRLIKVLQYSYIFNITNWVCGDGPGRNAALQLFSIEHRKTELWKTTCYYKNVWIYITNQVSWLSCYIDAFLAYLFVLFVAGSLCVCGEHAALLTQQISTQTPWDGKAGVTHVVDYIQYCTVYVSCIFRCVDWHPSWLNQSHRNINPDLRLAQKREVTGG